MHARGLPVQHKVSPCSNTHHGAERRARRRAGLVAGGGGSDRGRVVRVDVVLVRAVGQALDGVHYAHPGGGTGGGGVGGVGGRLRPPLTTRGMGWGARRGARAHDPPPMITGRRGRYGGEMGEMQGRYRAHVPPPIISAVAAIVGLLRTSCVLPAPEVGGARSARERGEAVAGGKGG